MVAEVEPGCGVNLVLFFLLLIGCVVAETMGTRQVFQRLQILESTAVEQLDRALLKVQNGIALCWTRQMTSIGQVVDTRVLWKLDK